MASIDNLLVSLFVDEIVGGFIVTVPPGHVGCIYDVFRGVLKMSGTLACISKFP